MDKSRLVFKCLILVFLSMSLWFFLLDYSKELFLNIPETISIFGFQKYFITSFFIRIVIFFIFIVSFIFLYRKKDKTKKISFNRFYLLFLGLIIIFPLLSFTAIIVSVISSLLIYIQEQNEEQLFNRTIENFLYAFIGSTLIVIFIVLIRQFTI